MRGRSAGNVQGRVGGACVGLQGALQDKMMSNRLAL